MVYQTPFFFQENKTAVDSVTGDATPDKPDCPDNLVLPVSVDFLDSSLVSSDLPQEVSLRLVDCDNFA